MEKLFVSYFDGQNQIPLDYARSSYFYIFGIIFLLFLILLRRKREAANHNTGLEDLFSLETTTMFRGIAVILAIVGHSALRCVDGVLPFRYVENSAPTIFLFVSGIGLSKSYGLSNLGKRFIVRRMRRLLFVFWITLLLFYFLNYLILHWTKSPLKIVITFLGLVFPLPPNDPAWFITYIVYLYLIYYAVSLLNVRDWVKCVIITLLSYCTTYAILYCRILDRSLMDYFWLWPHYAAVFPLGVLIGQYREKLFSYLRTSYNFSPLLFWLTIMFFLFLYGAYVHPSVSSVTPGNVIGWTIKTVKLVSLIMVLMMIAYLLDDIKYESRMLTFLGKYSFEIYMLHYPFMVYYDFFLFRRPLAVYFIAYCIFIMLLSYGLKRSSEYLNRVVWGTYGLTHPGRAVVHAGVSG